MISALSLSQGEVSELSLNGLTSLSDQQAKSLSRVGRGVYLDGLTSLTDQQAASLGQVKEFLSLRGLGLNEGK